MKSNFINSAIPSLISHIESLLKYNSDHVDKSQIENLLNDYIDKYLSTIGIALTKGEAITPHIVKRYGRIFKKIKSKSYFKNIELTIDSGGYQIQNGFMNKQDVYKYIDIYYNNFLPNYYNNLDYAFMVDIAPGINYQIFDNYDEMLSMNKYSYEMASKLPEDIRKKLIYIHHFRTKQINDVYMKLYDSGMFNGFYNFSTGGLINTNKTFTEPVILFAIPLIPVLTHIIKSKIKKFRYHALGIGSYKDIIIHRMLEYHIKETYDIDIEITYDSSTVFKTLAVSRFIYYPDIETKTISKMFVREQDMDNYFLNNKTTKELLIETLNKTVDKYGMKLIENSNIYSKEGTISNVIYTYGYFQMMKLYKLIDEWSIEFVKNNYHLYKSGDFAEFSKNISDFLNKLNSNNPTRSTFNRQSALINTLDMIKSLDINYYNYCINTYIP